jgi:hypothetical protein
MMSLVTVDGRTPQLAASLALHPVFVNVEMRAVFFNVGFITITTNGCEEESASTVSSA